MLPCEAQRFAAQLAGQFTECDDGTCKGDRTHKGADKQLDAVAAVQCLSCQRDAVGDRVVERRHRDQHGGQADQ